MLDFELLMNYFCIPLKKIAKLGLTINYETISIQI